jgi:serine/threonine protein kinase
MLRSGGLGDEDRDEDRMRRFTQEARTASSLNHPNIVTIYEISTHDGAPVIVMEYVLGKSLDHLIPRNGMRLSEIFKISGEVAGALAAAAAAGVIPPGR